ncbi:MAG TPA: hypothetical protein DDY43_05520 [Synechococcales bacterium UBA10510]|jgi:hypothetical protein|nr:hypothetical protein [Synechococcales bacterium UBA10510]
MTTAIPTTSTALLCQGDCIRIADDEQVYQVIGVDASHDRCWLRPWPLTREGSQVFEMSLQQVVTKVNHRPVRLD